MKTLLTTIVATLALTTIYLHFDRAQVIPLARTGSWGFFQSDLTFGLPEHAARIESQASEIARVEKAKQRYRARVAAWSPEPLLVETIVGYRPRMSSGSATRLAKALIDSGRRHQVDPLLLAALISKESRFNPRVISPGGAVGLGQLLPGTAARLGVNPHDPIDNIEGCAKYLGRQLRRWKHREDSVRLALASYNAGPGAVERYGTVPPYRVTQHYVSVITRRRKALKKRASALAHHAAKALAHLDSQKSKKS